MRVEYFHIYDGDGKAGNLAGALEMAYEFIRKVGEECITHVFTDYDRAWGWTVNVLYDASMVTSKV